MNTRNKKSEFIPPHLHPEKIINRYFEGLMDLTYKNPVLMKDLIYGVGMASLFLIPAPWILPALGINAPLGATLLSGTGLAGLAAAAVSGFAQQRVYGFPAPKDQYSYRQNKYKHKTAIAEISFTEGDLPILRIKADEPFDAGYAEGYILGEAIENNLENTDFLYPAMRVAFGAPSNNQELKKYLAGVLNTIPAQYQEEMLGKVKGYNDWLVKNKKSSEKLTFEYYLLLQLLPDLNNYNPFPQNNFFKNLASFAWQPKMGCTTIALRLGEYTFLTRVLDWPAHNVAGKSLLQVERKIGDAKRTIDIGLPLLSGAATVLNEKGLLIEINISLGDKVIEPTGMPAFFFNRFCAENANTVKEIKDLIQDKHPLGAYHLTATDGCDTQSFHFYQNTSDTSATEKHAIEILLKDDKLPRILVVANNGVKHIGGNNEETNHCDSNQRVNNIHQFFKHHNKLETFLPYINKQKSGELSELDLLELKELLLQVARLPLVDNCESVLCAMYIYHHGNLIEGIVATDNMYAQNKGLSEFRRLTI